MCDFAADAKAAEELMVGRTLTVARVRELNAKDYFYQMLKDNPEMLKIYPGIENELLQGAIDCHIHAYPDFVHRSQDMIQIAIEASKCGMRAIAFKDHWNISATSAYLTQRHIDDMIAAASSPTASKSTAASACASACAPTMSGSVCSIPTSK